MKKIDYNDAITIVIEDDDFTLVTDYKGLGGVPLNKGFIIRDDHYGIRILKYVVGKGMVVLNEIPTENPILAVAHIGELLEVFERGKRMPWIFRDGKVVGKSAYDTTDLRTFDSSFVFMDNPHLFSPEPKNDGTVTIHLENSQNFLEVSSKNGILKSFNLKRDVIVGANHYGFKLVRPKLKETSFPTVNELLIVKEKDDELLIFEEGKHFPWKFTLDGEFKSASNYMPYLARDIDYANKIIEDEGRSITIRPVNK